MVLGDSNRAGGGLGSRVWGRLGIKPGSAGVGGDTLGHSPRAGGSAAGGAVLSVAAALSHSSHLGKPGRPGDGEDIQPKVLVMCCGCRSQESQGWVRLGSSSAGVVARHCQRCGTAAAQLRQGSRMRGSA